MTEESTRTERPSSYPGWDGALPRRRATVLIARGGAVLLVRDRGRSTYMLPGGGVERGETPIAAAARELYEETGLEATSLRYLLTFPGKYNDHYIYAAEAGGEVAVGEEVDGFIWWDGLDPNPPVYPHVRGILNTLKEIGEWRA